MEAEGAESVYTWYVYLLRRRVAVMSGFVDFSSSAGLTVFLRLDNIKVSIFLFLKSQTAFQRWNLLGST